MLDDLENFNVRLHLNLIHTRDGHKGSLIRQLYLQLLGQLPKVPWKGLMYHNQAIPKAIFTTWMYLHGRLLTTDRLIPWGIIMDTTCCLCSLATKTIHHLFTDCRYTRQIWIKIESWLQLPQVPDLHHWIIESTKGNNHTAKLLKLVYSGFSYAVWIERNTRIF